MLIQPRPAATHGTALTRVLAERTIKLGERERPSLEPAGSPAVIAWARAHVSGLEISDLGPAGHHAPEDVPHEIGAALAAWLERHRSSVCP